VSRLVAGSRPARIVSFLLGAALLTWLALSNGVRPILADLSRVGPGVVVILALEYVAHAFNTLGWWFTLPAAGRAGTFTRLFWVRSAGNALNASTPLASLGGESMKIFLLRGRVSTAAATASLLTGKISGSAAQTIFVVVGMAAVSARLRLPHAVSLALLSGFVVMVTGIAVFAALQVRGIGAGTISLMRQAGAPPRWVASLEASLHGVDAHIRDFYRTRTGDLARSMAAHGGALACGTLQILLMISWLGLGHDVVAAVGIEAFSTLVALVMFAVPGTLGVQEGGKVLVFGALGLAGSAAMAVGITFRLIALIDTVVGLAALALIRQRLQPAAVPLGQATVKARAR
jgi:uncharacterized protein (TIRG00374 family)